MAEAPTGIYVLAGTNGAGKSSIGGALFRRGNSDYFNPDEWTQRILAANPGLSLNEANGAAWQQGRLLLERAIRERLRFAFETTLGGSTIPALLAKAAADCIEVRIWYSGLSCPELHLARVRARVAKGGHDIPEAKIRQRYLDSRLHLIDLLPFLAELYVYDNSAESDPDAGHAPKPVLVLHMAGCKIVGPSDLSATPEWAKPIVAAALKAAKT
ncbi:MAG: ZTL protein [Panacagrimonas sp.]